jgi:hypothetical protein
MRTNTTVVGYLKTSRSTGERSRLAQCRRPPLGGGLSPPVVGVVVAAAGSCENIVPGDMTEPAGTEGTHPSS